MLTEPDQGLFSTSATALTFSALDAASALLIGFLESSVLSVVTASTSSRGSDRAEDRGDHDDRLVVLTREAAADDVTVLQETDTWVSNRSWIHRSNPTGEHRHACARRHVIRNSVRNVWHARIGGPFPEVDGQASTKQVICPAMPERLGAAGRGWSGRGQVD